jgi:hypothetical protein
MYYKVLTVSFLWVCKWLNLNYSLYFDNYGLGFESKKKQGFRFPHSVQIGSGVHSASYQMVTCSDFPPGKAAEEWSWPLDRSSAEVKKGVAVRSLPFMSSWHRTQLISHKENFTFICINIVIESRCKFSNCMPSSLRILSRFEGESRSGLDWWMDLLTTYIHHSVLPITKRLSLISTLYKSLHAKSHPACSAFTSRCLVTNINNRDSSTSVLTPLPAF